MAEGGRGERIRTSDPLLPKQVRYQTAPRPEWALLEFLTPYRLMVCAIYVNDVGPLGAVCAGHAAGRREWVPALARAAVAAGADGLIVEVHPDPPSAASDGRQSLTPEGFMDLMGDLRSLADAVGRSLDSPEP